jgi:hypothetical protein
MFAVVCNLPSARCYIPENRNLNIHRHEKIKSPYGVPIYFSTKLRSVIF